MLRLALLFSVTILAFDAVAALVARTLQFNYGQFAILAVVLFAGFGILAGRMLPVGRGIVAILIAAAVDAIVGSLIASAILPGRPVPAAGTSEVFGIAVLAVVPEAVAGIAGAFVGSRIRRRP